MEPKFPDRRVRSSIWCFVVAAVIALLSFALFPFNIVYAVNTLLVLLAFLIPVCKWDIWRYSLQSVLLGFIFTYCLLSTWYLSDRRLAIFAGYVTCLSAFHYLEFIFTALTSIETLDHSSFLLDHSVTYWVAAVGSWIEFFIEYFMFPNVKKTAISCVGIAMVITGEILRKFAMVHARGGFTHTIARYRRSNHVLVTDGVYGVVRHPGYVGWYLWCTGTQVLLCNPVCVLIYAISTWFFFNERIRNEERLLLQFFGEQYRHYQNAVPIGIPFVRGYHES